MFAQIKLLHGFPEPLWYRIPEEFIARITIGTLIQVPLRNKIAAAIIVSLHDTLPTSISFTIKSIAGIEPFPANAHYHQFLQFLGHYHQVDPLHFLKRIRQFVLHEKPLPAHAVQSDTSISKNPVNLTSEQQTVCDFASSHIRNNSFAPILLHGITGSGKTEVYKNLITQTIAAKKTAILLLPEVTLALQFQKILTAQLPSSIIIHGFHSAVSTKQKRILWQQLIDEKPMLIIGVHLPILLPITNIGCIIVDEEHDVGYQEKKHPKINTKEAALWRAKLANAPILLGSATPSISSLYNVKSKGWHFFQLKQRFGGALPHIESVILTDKKRRKNFWISLPLENAIQDRLAKKEQIILFLNRRGFSFFVQCKLCTYIFICKNCSVSLTLHESNMLTCHYCGIIQQYPSICMQCKAANFVHKGIGTQQLVQIIANLFPEARIGRADLDVTAKKQCWKDTMQAFEHGELDILIGTQTIAKGFHFPRVTLVGIIWADLNVHFPIYNASETALQQLIQVAGRAGREKKESLVIVQSMAEHSVLNFIDELSYLSFYETEVETRKSVGYPPCMRLVEIELKSHDELSVGQEAKKLAAFFHELCTQKSLPISVLGPAKPPVHMIKNVHMRKIYLKSNDINSLIRAFQSVDKQNYKSQIYFTPNPLH